MTTQQDIYTVYIHLYSTYRQQQPLVTMVFTALCVQFTVELSQIENRRIAVVAYKNWIYTI